MFVYDNNKDSFVQTNLPGISGYGQKGSQGDTGDKGGSVYFTSYNMSEKISDVSVFSDFKYCIDTTYDELQPFWSTTDGHVENSSIHGADYDNDVDVLRNTGIVNRKMFSETKVEASEELSNNPNYQNKGVFYNWVTDSIVDINGDVFELVKWTESPVYQTPVGRFQKTHNIFKSEEDSIITVDASIVTTFNDSTQPSSYKQINKFYVGYEKNAANAYRCAPQTYYRDYYNEYSYGNVIKVTVNHLEYTHTNYSFKYVLCLPSGEQIEKYSKSDIEYIFVDNRFLHGCILTSIPGLHSGNSTYTENSPTFTQNYAKFLYTRTINDVKYSPSTIYVELINMTNGHTSIIYANSINMTV